MQSRAERRAATIGVIQMSPNRKQTWSTPETRKRSFGAF
jgi:hypothetical protein